MKRADAGPLHRNHCFIISSMKRADAGSPHHNHRFAAALARFYQIIVSSFHPFIISSTQNHIIFVFLPPEKQNRLYLL